MINSGRGDAFLKSVIVFCSCITEFSTVSGIAVLELQLASSLLR